MTKTVIAGLMMSSFLIAAIPAASAQEPAPAGKPAKKPAGKSAAETGAAKPDVPKPSPELETLKFLNGAWSCETSMPAGAMGPDSPAMKSRTTIAFKKDLGGFFYRGDFQMKTKPAMKGSVFIGHQPASSLFTFSTVDSMGGVELATSPGFQGDTIEFTGDAFMMGQKMKVRETITKTGPKELVHKVEADSGKGFEPMGEDHCKQ